MTREERTAHRRKIGAMVEAGLGMFPQRDLSDAAAAIQTKWWCDKLEHFPAPVVEAAFGEWIGREKWAPSVAEIARLCRERMPKPRLALPEPEPVRNVITAERAAEIAREAGFGHLPVVANLVRRMPRAGGE